MTVHPDDVFVALSQLLLKEVMKMFVGNVDEQHSCPVEFLLGLA